MSKEYVMQLEATIANLRRDNQMLKEHLEVIDNSDSNEALKCLELLGDFEWHNKPFKECFPDLFNTIKNYILKAQEQEKENAKYKQLEEEIECPLEVIIKACRDGIYGYRKIYDGANAKEIEVFDKFDVCFDGYSLWNEYEYEYNYDETFKVSPISNEFHLSDYKKTWWLKADKSE